MGLKPSPYFTIKATHLGFELANGDQNDPFNALQWSSVHLNLPGSHSYDPSRPWVMHLNSLGEPAGATTAYVDDLRPVGNSWDHCFQVAHQTASRLGYLGIQVAARKTRPPANSLVLGQASWLTQMGMRYVSQHHKKSGIKPSTLCNPFKLIWAKGDPSLLNF